MFTLAEAQTLGWTFSVDGDDGVAYKDGVEQFQVTSGVPLFAIVLEIADREGIAPPDRTAEAIKQATGEDYVEPPVDEENAAMPTGHAMLAELDALPPAQVATVEQLAAALRSVL